MDKFEDRLRRRFQARSIQIDPAKREQTAQAAQAIYQAHNQKEQALGFAGLVLWQLRFGGWKWGVVQLGILSVLGLVLFSLVGSREIMYAWSRPQMAYGLSCLATLVLSMAIPILMRSRRYKMDEVELASKFSQQGLVGAQLIWLLVSDVLFLAVLGLGISRRSSLLPGCIIWALAVPFFVLACGYMLALVHATSKQFEILSIAMSVGMLIALSWLKIYWPQFFEKTFDGSWLLVCLLLGTVMVFQWRKLLKQGCRWL